MMNSTKEFITEETKKLNKIFDEASKIERGILKHVKLLQEARQLNQTFKNKCFIKNDKGSFNLIKVISIDESNGQLFLNSKCYNIIESKNQINVFDDNFLIEAADLKNYRELEPTTFDQFEKDIINTNKKLINSLRKK